MAEIKMIKSIATTMAPTVPIVSSLFPRTKSIGMIVIGLASLIIGLSVFGKVRFMKPTTMVIIGSVIYQGCLGIATLLGVPSAYNKIIMAALFTVALVGSGAIRKRGEQKNVRA